MLSKLKNRKKGFTLIELMIVLAIIGILAAIAVPQITGYLTSSRNKAAITALRNLDGAQTQYFDRFGAFATDLNSITTWQPEQSVTVDIIAANSFSWSATAYHTGADIAFTWDSTRYGLVEGTDPGNINATTVP